jgi:hypothetical protein
MSNDAARFRKHAFECRRLANDTLDGESRQMLIEIAEDLEAEADKIDWEEHGDQSDKS